MFYFITIIFIILKINRRIYIYPSLLLILAKSFNSLIYIITFIRFTYYSYYRGINIIYNFIIITSLYYPLSYLFITFNKVINSSSNIIKLIALQNTFINIPINIYFLAYINSPSVTIIAFILVSNTIILKRIIYILKGLLYIRYYKVYFLLPLI